MRRMLRTLRPRPANPDGPLPDVEVSEWWTRDQIAEYQSDRLRRIVAHAWEESPFYREWMQRAGVRPSTIQGIDDLPAIPPVTRGVVQEQHDRILIRDLADEEALSGGTTGHRLRWARTVPWLELFTACLWRGFGWAGFTRGTRMVSFYSRVMGQVTEDSLRIEGAFDISRVEDDLRRIKEYRPEVAYVYASAAHVVARYLLDRGRTLPLRTVITSCDTLFPEQRPVISEAFRAEVFDNYGCNDGGAWGAECAQHDGLHQDVERAIVELDEGRMLTTDLWNTAFPFIRYENGDAARWHGGSCACGRSSPRFSIIGRSTDLLVTPTKVVFPSTLNQALLVEGLDDARVVQHTDREVEVLLVINERFDDEMRRTIDGRLGELFDGMTITVRSVEAIPVSVSGKHRVGVNLSGLDPSRVWGDAR